MEEHLNWRIWIKSLIKSTQNKIFKQRKGIGSDSLKLARLRQQNYIYLFFFRRMFAALKQLRFASKLSHTICLGKEPGQGQWSLDLD